MCRVHAAGGTRAGQAGLTAAAMKKRRQELDSGLLLMLTGERR